MMDFLLIFTTFADQWLGTALSKLFLLFLGILLCIFVAAAVWDRRIKSLAACIGGSLGLLLAAVALSDGLVSLLGNITPAHRIRLTAGIISFGMLVLTTISAKRSGLHLRFVILWYSVSLLVFLTAIFPGPLSAFPSVLGVQYGMSVVVLGLLFLLLLSFHLSLIVSNLEDKQDLLKQRITRLERHLFNGDPIAFHSDMPVQNKQKLSPSSLFLPILKILSLRERFSHGTALTAPLLIVLTVGAVFITGMLAPQVMIGDEVTHYYMMRTQADNLLTPNFFAEIPTGWGEIEIRRYPHSFLWHYLAAVLFAMSNGSFWVIQIYQTFFLAQLLLVAYLLSASRGGVASRSALFYLLLVASLPMTLIFSVAFYQDVPMAAQVLTAFFLLRHGRWLLATFFLCLALGLKVTAILFFPAFFCCLLYWTYKPGNAFGALLILVISLSLSGGFTWGLGKVIEKHSGAAFYPAQKVEALLYKVNERFFDNGSGSPVMRKQTGDASGSASYPIQHAETITHSAANQQSNENGAGQMTMSTQATIPQVLKRSQSESNEQIAEIIANHPGDLRRPANFVIFGGILLYLTTAGALLVIIGQISNRLRGNEPIDSSVWLWGTGLSYILIVAVLLKTSPDARFFLPGLIFCLLPISERLVYLPRPRVAVMIVTTLALMQAGYALAKTYNLRKLAPETEVAIRFLRDHPPTPHKIFMYPEGNYRLFPTPHDWYLDYRLRDFWRADNDMRLTMLRGNGIGAIVVKKQLVASVDSEITNLGVYPVEFVEEISKDSRFQQVFDNSAATIYLVPGLEK